MNKKYNLFELCIYKLIYIKLKITILFIPLSIKYNIIITISILITIRQFNVKNILL